MRQADKLVGKITVTGSDTFTMPIDTSTFNAFVIPVSPGPHQNTCAQAIPIGEDSGMLRAATQNTL